MQIPDESGSVRPLLSICIATFKRGGFIGRTLDSILDDLPAGVEIVILDGASPDNTQQVVESYARRTPALRYFRESTNSGIDRDYDKAVGFANGEYCWLMSDDDLLVPGAVGRVMALLEPTLDLIVVNAQIRSADLRAELNPRILKIHEDVRYDAESFNSFFADVGDYLSFIGGVVIRREHWRQRERERYFGTLFIHVGVVFQAPFQRVRVIAEPLIVIRYGNAMWTNRGFEIWMFKWPELIWSFADISSDAKAKVVARQPWKQWRRLLMYRAIGAYSYADYRKFFKNEGRGGILQLSVSYLPPVLANSVIAIYWYISNKDARAGIYDLASSINARSVTRLIARRLDIPAQ
jgi:glycosyltransferase involved in cell wall biosynthesis